MVNTEPGECGTALQAAARKGHLEVIKHLVGVGADVHSCGEHLCSTLTLACGMMESASLNAIPTVKVSLEKGADVNVGHALQAACAVKSVNIKLVALLLARGAEVNAQIGCYGTALQAACARYDEVHHPEAKWYTTRSDKGGVYLPMRYEKKYGQPAASLLLEKGADVRMIGGRHSNTLYAACDTENWRTVDLLLNGGSKVNLGMKW